MTTRVELIALAQSVAPNNKGIASLLWTYESLVQDIVSLSVQLGMLAELAKDSVQKEDRSPSLDNSSLLLVAHNLARKQTGLAELLMTIAIQLQACGVDIQW